MILHTVLLQPKSETTHEEMLAVLEQTKALKEQIPGIVDVQVGPNQNKNNYGYTYGLFLHFIDEAHLQAYFPHPAHRAVGAELRRLCSTLLNFDLPTE